MPESLYDYNIPTSYGGGGSSGGDAFSTFMASFAGSGGNPLVAAGITAGGELLGDLAGLLRGETDAQKRAGKTFSLAENRLGQDVLKPEQYLADYMRTLLPQFNREAESINTRLGLDSGVAQGALAESRQSQIGSFLLDAKMQNDVLKSRNDNMLLNLMGSLGRG